MLTKIPPSIAKTRHYKDASQYLVWYNSNRGKASRLFSKVMYRARVNKLEVTIDMEWILERLNYGRCEVTGIKFEDSGNQSPFGPSIDRKNPSLGYTKENSQVVVFIYNTAKHKHSHEDVMRLARALLEEK